MLNYFSIMLGEEDNTGYTGYIGHTAPRCFVPTHHIAVGEKKNTDRPWSKKGQIIAQQSSSGAWTGSVPGTSCSCRLSSGPVRL